jgi:hypothetical protein
MPIRLFGPAAKHVIGNRGDISLQALDGDDRVPLLGDQGSNQVL